MDVYNRGKGFTLYELLISIALTAVILALAAPSFQSLVERNSLSVEATKILSLLSYVRTEAIKRNSSVSLCPSLNGLECDSGSSWMDGWIVFSDQAKFGELDHENDRVLRVGEPVTAGYILYSTKHQQWFGYRSDGVSVGSSGSGNTSFVICRPEGLIEGSRVVVSTTGRPRFASGLDGKLCEASDG